jgi:hypothetical protein
MFLSSASDVPDRKRREFDSLLKDLEVSAIQGGSRRRKKATQRFR